LGFQDESGVSEKPNVRTTWAIRGRTPTLISSGSWKKLTLVGVIVTTPEGYHSRLLIRSIAGGQNTQETIRFLADLKRHMKGRKLLLFWDGLPAHRSKKVMEYLKTQSSWLHTARLPSYAPELNPIEYLWGAMKKKHLGNLRAEGMKKLGSAVRKAKKAMNDTKLLRGFLKASRLY
jgi:transposase